MIFTISQNPETGSSSGLCDASEVAQILGISVKTVHKLVREGKLPCVQVIAIERAIIPMLLRSNTLSGAFSTFQNFIR
jgi:hypothetical protein